MLGEFDVEDAREERFHDGRFEVQLLQKADLTLCPSRVPFDALGTAAARALFELDTRGEVGDEGTEQELGLEGVGVFQVGENGRITESLHQLLAVDEASVFGPGVQFDPLLVLEHVH